VVTDGFWLDDPNLVPGSTVRYRYWADGGQRTGEFIVAPGPQGQFIYTGGMPSSIDFLDVLPPGASPGMGLVEPDVPPPPPTPPQPPPEPSPPPFTGFPPAY
jgi:hypothetical protein